MTQIFQPHASLRGHYAGFVTRSIAFVIDLVLVVLTQVTFLLIVRLVLDFFGLNALAQAIFEPTEATDSSLLIVLLRWGLALFGGSVLFNVYVIAFWLLVNRTIGQAILGLRVMRTDGQPLKLGPAVRRVIGYYVSFFALFIGFLWILLDDRRQGWHDKLADTVVVYDWDARLGRRLREWLETHRPAVVAPVEPPDSRLQG
ncbi:MAG: RDD family protein [Anaerolineae bacterium]|uniref:RDD family protein n=1 Tax=Promineifilum sp. TaxID=2664178 RepID=UPI001D216EBD|nr:RDD family protein [Anaerolineales bacterium]MCB8935293.1 RDD family protein [Promineifilum sp.]MCO5178923.1 RDD family protein [Promineifilum sp.]MCW5847993.1 RDD family protein [Anaerolineae bacterium]